MKFSPNGDIIWASSIIDTLSNSIELSTELNSTQMLHVFYSGEIVISDSQGENAQIIYKIANPSNVTVRVDRISENGSSLLFEHYYKSNGVDSIAKHLFSKDSLKIFSTKFVPGDITSYNVISQSNEYYFTVQQRRDTLHLFKYDLQHVIIWEKKYVIPEIEIQNFVSTNNNEYFVLGHEWDWTLNIVKARLIQFDDKGSLLNNKTYLSKIDSTSWRFIQTIIKSNPNSYILLGYEGLAWFTDLSFTILDEELNEKETYLHHIGGEGDNIYQAITTSDNCIVLSGKTHVTDVGGISRAYVMKVDQISTRIKSQSNNIDYLIYPNPTKSQFQIYCEQPELIENIFVFDVKGNLVLNMSGNTNIDLSDQLDGVFFVQIVTQNYTKIVKVMKY